MIDGPVRLVFVPVPGISVEKIAIPGGLPARRRCSRRTPRWARSILAALLTGRVRVADLTLFGPHIALVADDKGNSSWGFHTGALAEIAAKNPNVRLPLSSIRLLNGTITYIDLGSGRTARDRRARRHAGLAVPAGDMSWSAWSPGAAIPRSLRQDRRCGRAGRGRPVRHPAAS